MSHSGLFDFTRSEALYQRAAACIPGAIPGHQSPALHVPGSVPCFAESGDGARYRDVDGNEFIDFLLGYGPVVLGHNDRVVEAAVQKQQKQGQCFNHPTERTVELAERLVSLTPRADWAIFGRNGSDVTTWAVRVAREHTGRRKVIVARDAYHGSHAWITPGHAGLIPEDRVHTLSFTWNDADELGDLVGSNENDVAAIMLTPYHHPAFGDSVLPAPGFFDAVYELCRRHGIVFVMDDIRACFRLHMGGSCELFGARPDIICYSKAMANGYAISAALGTNAVKRSASKLYFSGSFFNNGVEQAAALATIGELEARSGIARMMELGIKLGEGLRERARACGLEVNVTGPPSLPNMTFTGERNFRRMQRFCAEACRRGIFFHPHHNWFLCTAHTQADISKALDVASECFDLVRRELGA